MFKVVNSLGRIVYKGLLSACKRYCEMYDFYGTWKIKK